MVELIVEHWHNPDGSNHYLWSVWRDGKRVEMGQPHATQDLAEQEGGQWCWRVLKAPPDRVTRL